MLTLQNHIQKPGTKPGTKSFILTNNRKLEATHGHQ